MRKRDGMTTVAGVIALLLVGSMAPAAAAPAVAKKATVRKAVKKPVRKTKRKVVVKKVAPLPVVIDQPVYMPPPPPALPAPGSYGGAGGGGYADIDRYRYIDDADALLATVGASPPDFGFRFDGIDGWAWQLSGGELVLAEPVGDHYRFYAFAAGELYPFFIGDDAYSYGFAGRALAAVYGDDGALVGWAPGDVIAGGAAWLAERGRAMRASLDRRRPVIADDWADSQGYFGEIELRFGDWRRRPDWSRYRAGSGARRHRDWRARLGDEGERRRDRADRFDRWKRDGYRGTPPASSGGWDTAPGTTTGRRPDRDRNADRAPRPGGWRGRRSGRGGGRPRGCSDRGPRRGRSGGRCVLRGRIPVRIR